MKTLKLHLILAFLNIGYLSFANYTDKIVGLGKFESTYSNFTDQEFKEEIYYTLKRNKILIDTMSTDESRVDYVLSGTIGLCNDRNSCFSIAYYLIRTKDNRTAEIYDEAKTKYYSESIEDLVSRSIMEMKSFQKTEEWDNYFMPGVAFDTYHPRNSELGHYYGPSAEFVFYSRSKKRTSGLRGPSRIKTYGKIGIMKAGYAEANDIFLTNVGINLSFEAKTNREYLLPYFGIETGALFSKDISTYNFTPVLGAQIISNQKVIWSVQGGYLYSTKRFDEYSGYQLKTSVNFLLWK